MHSLLTPADREAILTRFRSLGPDVPRRWGRMSAAQMLTHLSDQMRHTLGDARARPRPGPLRWPMVKQAVMFWLPWPRGWVQGPPEAFVTRPTTWEADLAAFETLVQRFVDQDERQDWPEHAFFGHMTRQSWGCFCYRHFDYHLRQFDG